MSDRAHPAVDTLEPGAEAFALEIRLFGSMEVWLGSQRLPRLRTRKGLWLLALLALRGGRDVERDWLAGTLWPDCDDAQARHSLRQCLCDLRRVLGPEAWRLTGERPRMLRLEVGGAFGDVLVFDARVERGDLAALEEAVRLYRGPLLAECAEEWVLAERQRREQAYLAALQRLAAAAAARGDHGRAASYLRGAVSTDPYQEELQRALMEALAGAGSPADALVVYRQFRALLLREMAAEPAEATTALFRRLREETRVRAQARTPEPPAAATPRAAGARCPPAPPSPHPEGARRRLPVPLTALIGRDEAVQEVIARLASARLVTLTGTGGIGKTRLALQVAWELAEEYENGAGFVNLAPLVDPERVPDTVRAALGVSETPGPGDGQAEPIELLRQYLSPRRLLLVLDNCEHLIEACARLADALLGQCPDLRILATSRQLLGVRGETVWRVPSLSVPDARVFRCSGVQEGLAERPEFGFPAGGARNTPTPEHLIEYAAVRLFVERARAAEASFEMTPRNTPAVVEVCRRLDGIPLAIELAASRVRAMPVEQIALLLVDRFRLLTGGNRTALPRQQTLRATLDWSYELLLEPERTLLRRLAVFSGGFTLEAVEAVCTDFGFWISDFGLGPTKTFDSPEAVPLPAIQNPKSKIQNEEVLDLLSQLVDKSLVGVQRREDVARYILLETTREYAWARLREAGEEEDQQARHAQFFLALAERAEPELRGAAQAQWLQRLEEEHDNCRAALDSCLAVNAIEAGLRLGAALGWFWWMRGYFSEGRERLQVLLTQSGYRITAVEHAREVRLAQPVNGGQAELRQPHVRQTVARVLNVAGMLADEQSDYETARALTQEGLALARELQDDPCTAAALNSLGGQSVRTRDFPAARALYEESLAISRASGEQWLAAASLTSLGRVAYAQHDYSTARSLVERGLEIQRQLEDRRAIARSLTTLGLVASRQGEYSAARALYEESLLLARELGARGVIEEVLNGLGTVARFLGDLDAAAAYHDERLAIAQELGNPWGIAEGLIDLALLARDRGDRAQAAAFWCESLTVLRKLGDPQYIADCLDGLARLAVPPSEMGPDRSDPGNQREPMGDDGSDGARRAARLFGAVAALRGHVGAPMSARDQEENEPYVSAVRAMLDEAAFAAAWAEGAAMTLEEAVADALQEWKVRSREGA